MKIGKSVAKALDEWSAGDAESAMLHACNAVDGTASRTGGSRQNNQRFTGFLRDNYAILGPMDAPGINLQDTRFPVRVRAPKAAGGQPDIADVIYGVHRCSHGHGEELPEGFDLVSDATGPLRRTAMLIEPGRVRLSDRVIFGLIAVVVAAHVNTDERVPPGGYHLSFAGEHYLPINDWWGRRDDMIALLATKPIPSVLMNFGEWMDELD